jgi:hypothetical protein
VNLNEDLVIVDMLSSAKSNFNKPFFMVATATWGIWKVRNTRIFYNVIPIRNSWSFTLLLSKGILSFFLTE